MIRSIWFGLEVALQAAKLVPVSERRRLLRQAENVIRRTLGVEEIEDASAYDDDEDEAELINEAHLTDEIGPEARRRRRTL